MKKTLSVMLLFGMAAALPAFATVIVDNPKNGESTSSNVQFVATANTTTCSKGVASMGVYVDNALRYEAGGTGINTNIFIPEGTQHVVVQEWDRCGGATSMPLTITVSNSAGVTVVTPANGASVGSPASIVATATTSCPRGVSAMGVYFNGQLKTVQQGAKLNAQVALPGGNQKAVVQEWDACGQATNTTVDMNVGGAASAAVSSQTTSNQGTTFYNIQGDPGWNQWGELPPNDGICSPCNGVNWAMYQHDGNFSLSGNSTQYNMGGWKPYADVLWSNPVLGQGNRLGHTDNNHTLLPTLHHFTLDEYVYPTNLAVTQSLELDINWYGQGLGMEWGTQCNHLGDGVWDIWDNVNAQWMPTNAPCRFNNSSWNHVVIQVERESNNDLLYQTITVNDVTYPINRTVAPFHVPTQWWGMTINFQMDGNRYENHNTAYLDKANFSYW